MTSTTRQLQLTFGAITPTPAIAMIENPRFPMVVSIGTTGAVLWARKFGSVGTDVSVALGVSGARVMIGGATDSVISGSKDLAGNSVSSNLGANDAFLAEVRTDGTPGSLVRVLQFGGLGNDSIACVSSQQTGFVAAGTTSSILAAPRLSGGGYDALTDHEPDFFLGN